MNRRGVGMVAAMVWLCARVAASQTPAPLSLHEAEQRALDSHPAIQAAEYTAEAAEQAVREARAVYFPSVIAGATAAGAEAGSRIAAGGLNNPIILDRLAAGVSVGQLITDFGRSRALVQSSGLRADAQRQLVGGRRADVLLQVDRAYFTALRAQAIQRVATETVTGRQLVADQVDALAASGLRSGLDASFARVNLSEARLLLAQADNDVEAAFAGLADAMGAATSPRYVLVEEPLPAEPPADSAALIQAALRDRPEIAAQRFTQQAAAKLADAERATSRPSIAAVAAFGASPYRQAALTSHYAAAGVTLNVPVTSGGLLPARRAEAALRASAEEQRLRDLENGVVRDVQTAWLDARAGLLRVHLTEELRTQAADAAELAQARYDIGLGSIVELSQAQLAKARADIEAASARYDYQIRTAALAFQTGHRK